MRFVRKGCRVQTVKNLYGNLETKIGPSWHEDQALSQILKNDTDLNLSSPTSCIPTPSTRLDHLPEQNCGQELSSHLIVDLYSSASGVPGSQCLPIAGWSITNVVGR